MADSKGYDPFADRLTLENSISDCQSMIHLVKATLGTGILSMPIAFMYTGLLLGIGTSLLTGLICGHCAYVLVKCAHALYYKEQKSKMTFSEVTVGVFMNGPQWAQSLTNCIKYFVINGMFLTYFGTCSVYTVVIARNFQQVLEYWTGEEYNIRVLIALFLIPLILLTWVPDLKNLAPISMVANLLVFLGILITVVYMVIELPSIGDRDYLKFDNLPSFFAISIFAMEAIGMMMPLENSMRTPTHFLGICGVLSLGMIVLTVLCIMLGFLGYWRYGPHTEESITLNLPSHEWPAQLVKLCIALAMYCTFGLQFTVILEIAWDAVKDNYTNRPVFANYVVRTLLVVGAVGLAVAVPSIAPFMGLIGAFCFSILGLILPVILESIMCIETGFGFCLWILWKNIFIVCFGIFALIFGSYSAIEDIAKLYQ